MRGVFFLPSRMLCKTLPRVLYRTSWCFGLCGLTSTYCHKLSTAAAETWCNHWFILDTQPGTEQGVQGHYSKTNTLHTFISVLKHVEIPKGLNSYTSTKKKKDNNKKPHKSNGAKNLFNLKTHFPGLINSQALPILSVSFTNKSQHFLQSEIIYNRFW